VSNLLVRILADAVTSGIAVPPPGSGQVPPKAEAALAPVRAAMPAEIPIAAGQTGLMMWAALFGAVSFELFGQFHNVVTDEPDERDAFFGECVRRWAVQLGIGTESFA
jgi:hypothetical protein